jgi:hypothetical protein
MSLSFESDRLIAIQSLADKFQNYFQEEYLSGLWRSYLYLGLCWKATTGRERLQDDAATCGAPSWSWASCRYNIEYRFNEWGNYTSKICLCIDSSPSILKVKGVVAAKPFANLDSLKKNGYDLQDWFGAGSNMKIYIDTRPQGGFSDAEQSTLSKCDLLYVLGKRNRGADSWSACIILEPVDSDSKTLTIKRYKRIGFARGEITDSSLLFSLGQQKVEIEII